MKKRDNLELDYLNPTNDKIIDLYLSDIKSLENKLHDYLASTKNPEASTIEYYETIITLKWDNLKFYKCHMVK